MNTFSVYNYENPHQFLLDYLANKQKEDKSYSVRKWAKDMELKSHSLLVMLLQGKRKLRVQHCEFLAKSIVLNTNERAYLQTLIQYQNADGVEEKKHILTLLSDLHPGEGFRPKEINEFTVLSDWIHMGIMAMTELKDFKGTEEEIAVLLNGKVQLTEIRSALIRLMDLDLLYWSDEGKLVPTFNEITTKDDVSSAGAREYHKQVINLASKAIDEQSLEDREFQSFTMGVAKEKIPLAKEMIRKFRLKLTKALSGEGDNVYQTSIQFFQLTSNSKNNLEKGYVAQDSRINGEK